MPEKLTIGDIVWAKMKGFPLWPGQIVEPGKDMKQPVDKKPRHYIHFYGSENNAWILEGDICAYVENRDKYAGVSRPMRGFLEAVEIADKVIAGETPKTGKVSNGTKKSNGHGSSRKRSFSKSELDDKNESNIQNEFSLSFNNEEGIFSSSHPDLEEAITPKRIIATPMRIGFLGLGHMGCGMVDNLLRSGHEVTVWNRTTAKCYEFTKDGALRGVSPADVVSSCDITFSCVSDPTVLKELVFGNCGVLQGMSSGKGFVDMSSVDVDTICDIHDAITFKGGRFLEAPVMGNRLAAKNGQLIILVAGDSKLYDDCKSCFQAMGKKRFHLGKVGNATKLKLIIESLHATTLAGLAETFALATKVGLDNAEILKIVNISTLSSPFLREKGSAMLENRITEPTCKLQVMEKDLRMAINLSDTVDQAMHVDSAVMELFKKAKAKGYGEYDIAALYRAADL